MLTLTDPDDGYESGGDNMPPPPRPNRPRPPRGGPGGANGKRKATNGGPPGAQLPPKKAKPAPSNSSRSSSTRHNSADLVMSGGLGHSTVSGSSVDEDEEDDNISDDWSVRHPTVPPEDLRPNAAGPTHPNQLVTPRTQHSMSRSAANEGIRPFNDWGAGNGAFRNGDQDGREQRNHSPSGLLPRGPGLDGDDGEEDAEDADRIRDEINGGMDEDEAFRAAMRASQAPEDEINGGMDDEQAFRAALRASQAPEDRIGVRASIEIDEGVEADGDE